MTHHKQEEHLIHLLRFGMEYDKQTLANNNRGGVRITRGRHAYEQFNFYFVHEMLSQILEVLYRGYLPLIDLGLGDVIWDEWLTQPFPHLTQNYKNLPAAEDVFEDAALNIVWGPNYGSPFEELERFLCQKLYADFFSIRDDIFSYIAREYQTLLQGKYVLGVLCRGTDMVTLQLREHPVQPDAMTLVAEAGDLMDQYGYEYIYLATEERRVQDLFESHFPGRILTNLREYYDEEYEKLRKQDENTRILFAYPQEKDALNRIALSYLSSMVLLSSCQGMIACNCSGSQAALYMNDGKYEHCHIYNLGFYE